MPSQFAHFLNIAEPSMGERARSPVTGVIGTPGCRVETLDNTVPGNRMRVRLGRVCVIRLRQVLPLFVLELRTEVKQRLEHVVALEVRRPAGGMDETPARELPLAVNHEPDSPGPPLDEL